MINNKYQTGAALFVALVILLIISLGSLSIMSGVRYDTKMNDNFEQSNISFQVVEEALRRIEKQVIEDQLFTDDSFLSACAGANCFIPMCNGPSCRCNNGQCLTVSYPSIGPNNCLLGVDDPVWLDDGIKAAAPVLNIQVDRSLVNDDAGMHMLPVSYLVEFRCYVPKVENPNPDQLADWARYFRVTVWVDHTDFLQAPIMLQSTYQKG